MGTGIQEQQEVYKFFKFAFRVSYMTLSKSPMEVPDLESYIQQHVLNFEEVKKKCINASLFMILNQSVDQTDL